MAKEKITRPMIPTVFHRDENGKKIGINGRFEVETVINGLYAKRDIIQVGKKIYHVVDKLKTDVEWWVEVSISDE